MLGPPDAGAHWAAIAAQLAAGRVAAAVRLARAGHQRGALAHYTLAALPGPPLAAAPPHDRGAPGPAVHQGPTQAHPPSPAPAADELWQPRGQGGALGFTDEELPAAQPEGPAGVGPAAAPPALRVRLEGCSAAGAAVVALALLAELAARGAGGGGGRACPLLRITTGAPLLCCCNQVLAWLHRWFGLWVCVWRCYLLSEPASSWCCSAGNSSSWVGCPKLRITICTPQL